MRIDRQNCIENIGRICAEYADILGCVILFGSVARNENTEASDIDLYVEPRDLAMTSGKLEKNKAYREFRLKLFDLYDGKVDYVIALSEHNNKTINISSEHKYSACCRSRL